MDSLRLMMEASWADEALAAQTTDQELQSAIARNRPDLRAALASNPAAHPDLLAWLAEQGGGAGRAARAALAERASEKENENESEAGEAGEDAAGPEEGAEPEGESEAGEAGEDAAGLEEDDSPEGESGADQAAEGDEPEDAAGAEDDGSEDSEGVEGAAGPEEGAEPEGESEADEAGEDAAGLEEDDSPEGESGADQAAEGDEPEDAAGPEEPEDSSDSEEPTAVIGLPAPPPSAEDIAAWAETPSQAPDSADVYAAPVSSYPAYPPLPPQAPPAPPSQPPRRARRPRRGVMLVAVILCAALACGLGWAAGRLTQDDAEGPGSEAGAASSTEADPQDAEGVDAAPGSQPATQASATPSSSTLTSCDSDPSLVVTSVSESGGSMEATVKVTTSCADGDFLDAKAVRVSLYGPSRTDGTGSADAVVASGEFDFSRSPLIIPSEGVSLVLSFGSGHYFRAVQDLAPSGGSSTDYLEARLSQNSSSASLDTQGLSSRPGRLTAAEVSSDSSVEEGAAGDGLQWYRSRDRSTVTSRLTGRWTPQLSSKRAGLEAEGIIWDNVAILAEFLSLRQTYPTAVLVYSDDWPVFNPGEGWWVTLSGVTYGGADEANYWCDAEGYDADHCYAKRMETSGSPAGTTRTR